MNSPSEKRHTFPSAAVYAIFGVVVALITLLLFPAISYMSVAFYGAPAAAFILGGFILWLVLLRCRGAFGEVFLVAFSAPVLFCLFPIFFTAVPYLPLVAVAPTAILWFIAKRKGLTRRWSERRTGVRSTF